MDDNEIKVVVVKYPDRKNLTMRFTDPMTGKQIARSTRTANHRQAERCAAKWEAELQEGRYKRPSMTTWEEFRERYEQEYLSGLADGTFEKVVGRCAL